MAPPPRPTARTRGRLPARVYWVRRALVVATALALVFAFTRLFVGSGDGDPGAVATVTGARPTPSTSAAPALSGPVGPSVTKTGSAKPSGKSSGRPSSKATAGDLVAPDGPCSVADITVTPRVSTAAAGRTIPVTLLLTGIRPACTFVVSPSTLAVKVTKGDSRLWSSQDCPTSISRQTVVVRSGSSTSVQVSWNGRRSTGTCSRANSWVLPGKYRVTAAAIGSEPAQGLVTLKQPPRPIVIKTIKPKPKKGAGVSPVTGKKTD
ncbi:MAG: hypothetical protein JWQ74_1172 [Marmoricola sp.]|nr:hypothetical protein [Marmoricola sp.]